MKNTLTKLLLISAFFAFLLPTYGLGKNEDFRIVSSSPTQLVIRFTPLDWQKEEKEIKGRKFTRYSFRRAELMGEPGSPQLPVRIIHIGVPPQGNVSYEILQARYRTESDILPLPIPEIEKAEIGYAEKYRPDEAAYESAGLLSQNPVTLEEPTFFRDQRTVRVILQPLQYSHTDRSVRLYQSITLKINFPAFAQNNRQQMRRRDESVYQQLLLNYEQAKPWRIAPARSLRKGHRKVFAGDNWYKIIIRGNGSGGKEGIYKIDSETLSKAGVPLSSVDPRTIQIFNNGGRELPLDVNAARPDSLIENPIDVVGEEDGKFDSGDYILFYGRSLEGFEYNPLKRRLAHYIHHYSYENVYWLTFGKKNGKRIAERASLSTTNLTPESSYRDLVWIEEEKHNIFASGRDWFGYRLSSDQKTYSFSFKLNKVIPEDTAIVRIRLATETAGAHRFRVLINGNKLGEVEQNGGYNSYNTNQYTFKQAGVLLEGTNTVTIEYITSSEISFAYVDWIEVEYKRRFVAIDDQMVFYSPLKTGPVYYHLSNFSRDEIAVYDVTDISAITRIKAANISNGTFTFAEAGDVNKATRYLALTPAAYRKISSIEKVETNDLKRQRTADYIIITYDDFYQQAVKLENLRESLEDDRLETEVVKISDVFNEFSWGIFDPTAIRDFLVYAQDNWGEPQYVLLLGDGHFDYKNILGYDGPNLIPPYETNDRYESSTRTTDDWFTYTRGNRSGMQMAIGRLPVQSVEEAESVIDKIVTYETKPDFGEWRKTVTIVADDELVVGGVGNETIHTQQAEKLVERHVPNLLDVKKIYLMEYPAVRTASVSGITKPAAKEALLDQINRGTLLLNFIGHGNDELWTHERVLNGPTDFDLIQNGDRMALWVAATCEFAHWDQPQKQSLAERILAVKGRGAVAMVSSARLAYAGENAAFNYALYDELFKDYLLTGRTTRIGDAVMIAKHAAGSTANSEKYGVFGDPAMRLGAPRYRVVIDSIDPDTIQALRKVSINGHVEKNGALWNDVDGKVLIRVMDSRKRRIYETAYGTKVRYMLAGNSVFRGVASVNSGEFKVELIVPKDISYGGTDGKVSAYFWNEQYQGTGVREGLIVGGTAVDLVDRIGPEIKLYFDRPDFSAGDYVAPNTTLYVEIADSLSGINLAGDIGHQIIMIMDGDIENAKDLTDFFEYDEGSYTKGKLKYPLFNLPEGQHTILVKAWDNSNNSSTFEVDFIVVAEKELKLRNALTYPNPMSEQATFSFEISRDAEVSIKIYSVAGRLVREFEPMQAEIGFNLYPEPWDGTDQDGDLLANGVYLYKITARSTSGEEVKTVDHIGKLLIAR